MINKIIEEFRVALLEARAVAEMAIEDEIESRLDHNENLRWYIHNKHVDVLPEEYAELRLTELRQNVKDIDYRSISNWGTPLEEK